MPPVPPPGDHRLPAKTRLGAVSLQVSELERSLRYYGEVLGLRALERSGSGATLGPGGTDVPLLYLTELPSARPVPPRGRLGLFHFALLLPERADLARLAVHLTGRGIRFGASDHRVSEAIYLADPDGLGIEVYADRPRSEWREEDEQLVMATDPLDLEALREEDRDGRWEGMPARTAVGHLHLHVGDLAEADLFYHRALGFDRTVWSYPGALFFSAGGYHHHLGVNTWAAGAPAAGPDDARLLEWELVLPTAADVERTLDSLTGHGAGVARGEGLVRDPWGTTLRLVEATGG